MLLMFLFLFFPPDTRLAHENGETCPCKRGEKRIHRPQCGDLTVSPQITVNNNVLYIFEIASITELNPVLSINITIRREIGNGMIIFTWSHLDWKKNCVFNISY